MWVKIWLFIKNIFTGLYKKPLIDIDQAVKCIKEIDTNLDNKISINEIWDAIIELVGKKNK